jgi:DNA repair exonuclease SbcCD ATPase subunit
MKKMLLSHPNSNLKQINSMEKSNVSINHCFKLSDFLECYRKEMEQRLNEHKNQIENLIQERAKLLEDIEKNTPSPIQTTDNEVQTDDDEHEKLLNLNNTLKQALETIGDKIHQVMTARSDLFGDIGEDTIARLDHLISTIESQTTQINVLQSEHDQAREKYRHEISKLQK